MKRNTYCFFCSLLVGVLLSPLSNIQGNISNSFRDSLSHDNSGRYLWNAWDFITSPYIYSLNQKNSVSFQFTENNFFSLGTSFFISEYPVFLATQFSNTAGSTTKFDPLPVGVTLETDSSNLPDINFMIGTLPFRHAGFLRNLGVGFYFRWRRSTIEKSFESIGNNLSATRKGETTLGNNREGFSVTSLGIEFGQFGGGVDVGDGSASSSGKISYGVAIGYNSFGVPVEEILRDGERVGANTAPFVEITQGGGENGFNALFPGQKYFGPKKREFTVNFLGWYVLNSVSNIGLAVDTFLQPELKGTDDSYDTREITFPQGQVSEVGVKSYRAIIEIFYDIDFNIGGDGAKIGVLRLSPAIQSSYHIEKAEFDEVLNNGKVDSQEHFVWLAIPFKFYVFLNQEKTFRLIAGWRPRFNLSHKRKQEIRDFNLSALEATPEGIFRYERRNQFLTDAGSLLDSSSLGCEYVPTKGLTLTIGVLSGSDGLLNFSSINFGIDYIL